jgi:threonylcarbamoyladenosine tRNA methylthiotransferase MtaB
MAIIVNTCAVTGEAVRQAKQSIRKARRENPERASSSPAAPRRPRRAFADMAEVDLVLGNEDKLKAHKLCRAPG